MSFTLRRLLLLLCVACIGILLVNGAPAKGGKKSHAAAISKPKKNLPHPKAPHAASHQKSHVAPVSAKKPKAAARPAKARAATPHKPSTKTSKPAGGKARQSHSNTKTPNRKQKAGVRPASTRSGASHKTPSKSAGHKLGHPNTSTRSSKAPNKKKNPGASPVHARPGSSHKTSPATSKHQPNHHTTPRNGKGQKTPTGAATRKQGSNNRHKSSTPVAGKSPKTAGKKSPQSRKNSAQAPCKNGGGKLGKRCLGHLPDLDMSKPLVSKGHGHFAGQSTQIKDKKNNNQHLTNGQMWTTWSGTHKMPLDQYHKLDAQEKQVMLRKAASDMQSHYGAGKGKGHGKSHMPGDMSMYLHHDDHHGYVGFHSSGVRAADKAHITKKNNDHFVPGVGSSPGSDALNKRPMPHGRGPHGETGLLYNAAHDFGVHPGSHLGGEVLSYNLGKHKGSTPGFMSSCTDCGPRVKANGVKDTIKDVSADNRYKSNKPKKKKASPSPARSGSPMDVDSHHSQGSAMQE